MKILDYINQKTDNAYKDYKLVSVIFDESSRDLTFKFLYKDELYNDAKEVLSKLIQEYFDESVNIIIKCKKAYVDCDLVRDVIYNFITKNFASVSVGLDKSAINVEINESIIVTITCSKFQYNYFDSSQNRKILQDYAEGFFFESFELKLILNEKIEELSELDSIININLDSEDNESKIKFHKIQNLRNFIGEVNGCPIQIGCINSPLQGVEVIGNIKFLNLKSFESKRKDKNGESVVKNYFNFNLSDGTGRINCVYFPTKSDSAKAMSLAEDMSILIHGDIEDFNGKLSFKVKSIAEADIVNVQEVEEVVDVIKEPFDKYYYVTPEPYIEMFQDNLFIKQDKIGQYLLDNDVVVFDIETTGLEPSRCEIIEIGAVKLHKGKISETFETLIKPRGIIPDEIIELTGITPDMVVDAPSINQVMPDFFKFCYGTTIMAYNIDFDYKFISVFGKKQGYLFDNKQIDAMYLARAFIPGLKNFKLSTVCKKLDVSLENAHRAVHDAMATAEVVIKLSPNIT